MNPYFYSLEMLLTGRGWKESQYLSAMDILATCIADDEREPPLMIDFLFRSDDGSYR